MRYRCVYASSGSGGFHEFSADTDEDAVRRAVEAERYSGPLRSLVEVVTDTLHREVEWRRRPELEVTRGQIVDVLDHFIATCDEPRLRNRLRVAMELLPADRLDGSREQQRIDRAVLALEQAGGILEPEGDAL